MTAAPDTTGLSDEDAALVEAATALLRRRWRPHRQQVAAAVRMADGSVHAAVNLDTHVSSAAVCAETGAIAMGVSAGGGAVDTIVAVSRPSAAGPDGAIAIVSPCGRCREVIADYGPAARVVIAADGEGARIMTIEALLPAKYARATSA